jgi:hypothetical protein
LGFSSPGSCGICSSPTLMLIIVLLICLQELYSLREQVSADHAAA